MFDFKPSMPLVRRILKAIRTHPECPWLVKIQLLFAREEEIERLRDAYGVKLVQTVGTYADRALVDRALIEACKAEKIWDGEVSFEFIKDGEFPEEVKDDLFFVITIPPGARGDALFRELAAEFIEFVRTFDNSALDPRARVTKLEVRGTDVVVYAHEREPLVDPDPNWEVAQVIE